MLFFRLHRFLFVIAEVGRFRTLVCRNNRRLLVIECHSASNGLLCQWVDAFHIGLQQVILVFDSVLDEILELLHLNLDDDLVYIRVSCAVTLLSKIAGQAVWIVS